MGPKKARVKPNAKPAPGPIGNTNGLIVPDTAPNPGGNSAPPIKPTEPEKSWWGSWGGVVHGALDVVGLIPVVGEVADGANALIYLAEGDGVNAALSAASMLPIGGQAATAAKWGKRGVEAAQAGSKVAKAEAKVVKEVVEKKVEKEAKEEAAEQGAKNGGKKGGKDKGKKKLKCGEHGKYGKLKQKTGDGKFDRDHIPSKAALKKRAEELLGDSLNPSQQRAIDLAGEAIAIPRQAHIDVSPTYGQSAAGAAADAKDLAGSAKRDVDEMLNKIDEYDADGGCREAYKKGAEQILKKTNADFDQMLIEVLKGVK